MVPAAEGCAFSEGRWRGFLGGTLCSAKGFQHSYKPENYDDRLPIFCNLGPGNNLSLSGFMSRASLMGGNTRH